MKSTLAYTDSMESMEEASNFHIFLLHADNPGTKFHLEQRGAPTEKKMKEKQSILLSARLNIFQAHLSLP